jgi:hypothetical protein
MLGIIMLIGAIPAGLVIGGIFGCIADSMDNRRHNKRMLEDTYRRLGINTKKSRRIKSERDLIKLKAETVFFATVSRDYRYCCFLDMMEKLGYWDTGINVEVFMQMEKAGLIPVTRSYYETKSEHEAGGVKADAETTGIVQGEPVRRFASLY